MKKKGIVLILLTSIILTSCQWPGYKTEGLSQTDSIALLEKELFDPTIDRLDKAKAIELINLYLESVRQNPNDSNAPEWLFKAADISINVQNPDKTIKIYDQILTNYPEYSKVQSVLFLKAFVYDDQLKDFDNAKKYYELFLEKYPDSEFADDAKASLINLGKTPEELIEEFEKNNP